MRRQDALRGLASRHIVRSARLGPHTAACSGRAARLEWRRGAAARCLSAALVGRVPCRHFRRRSQHSSRPRRAMALCLGSMTWRGAGETVRSRAWRPGRRPGQTQKPVDAGGRRGERGRLAVFPRTAGGSSPNCRRRGARGGRVSCPPANREAISWYCVERPHGMLWRPALAAAAGEGTY